MADFGRYSFNWEQYSAAPEMLLMFISVSCFNNAVWNALVVRRSYSLRQLKDLGILTDFIYNYFFPAKISYQIIEIFDLEEARTTKPKAAADSNKEIKDTLFHTQIQMQKSKSCRLI